MPACAAQGNAVRDRARARRSMRMVGRAPRSLLPPSWQQETAPGALCVRLGRVGVVRPARPARAGGTQAALSLSGPWWSLGRSASRSSALGGLSSS
ncbi:hypothetical protein [Lysobacter gummosus]|uniref:hypothetical protein n=1 Tax=Lysobacter gummosus TaxID=262324 RepID=UPI0036296EA3